LGYGVGKEIGAMTNEGAIGTEGRVTMLVLVALLAGSGCGIQPAGWAKPGGTSAELRRDLADCERQGTGPPPFHFWALNYDYAGARDRIVRLKTQCMLARGWRSTAVGAVP
jgi:hypothetical protein